MNRQFRIALFVSVAGAVGLHARPCLITCVVGGASCDAEGWGVALQETRDQLSAAPHAALAVTAEIASVLKPRNALPAAPAVLPTRRRPAPRIRPALRALSSPVAPLARTASWTPAGR